MKGAYGSSYVRFLPSNYFSEKIETDQIHIGKEPLVFKNYWKRKNKISKITLKRIMMRARTENAIAHLKKSNRSPFRDSREQNKKRMDQYGRRTKTDASPSSLESAHMRSDKKYGLPVWQQTKSRKNQNSIRQKWTTIFGLERWNLQNRTQKMGPTKCHRSPPHQNIKK